MKLLDLFRSAGIAAQPLDAGAPALNPTVQSIATDSRTVMPGSLFAAPRGRLEKIRLPQKADIYVVIDYAHTPDALEKCLCSVREITRKTQTQTPGHICVVFGCGGDRDKTKRPQMGKIAERLADTVYLTADNSRSEETDEIIREILTGMDEPKSAICIPDRETAIRTAISNAQAGDTVLLAGKGHETYEIMGQRVQPFDEVTIAVRAVEERIRQNREND